MGTTKTQTSKMDPLQQEFLSETLLPFAKDIAAQQYQLYEGERVAGLTPLQQQSMGGYGALSMGGPLYGQAAQAYGNLAGFQAPTAQAAQIDPTKTLAGANIGQYMSPYTQEVIDRTQQDIARQQQSAQNTLGAEATRAGAFGGSRHGVAEGTLAGEYGRMAGDIAAQQRQQAFINAQAAAGSDIAAQNARAAAQAALQQQAALANQQVGIAGAGVQATGAAGLGSIAGQQLQSQLAGLGAQMQAGEIGRGLEQARLDVPYQDYLAAMNYPLTQFGVLTGASGAFPAGLGTQQQKTPAIANILDIGGKIGSAYVGTL
jgi:hypothetical protein